MTNDDQDHEDVDKAVDKAATTPAAAAAPTGPTFSDDPGRWEIVSTSYIARKDWFTVRLDHVRLPTGAEIPEYWVSEYRPWVNVVAVTDDQQVVLIRQYRHGLGAVHFEIPAGTTDAGEHDLEAAARRELAEETGYGGGRWSPLFTLSANPALQNNLTYTFLAEGVSRLDRPRPESNEDLRIHLIPVAEVAALIEGGGFIQALHIAPLLRYLMRRLVQGGIR